MHKLNIQRIPRIRRSVMIIPRYRAQNFVSVTFGGLSSMFFALSNAQVRASNTKYRYGIAGAVSK